MRTLTWLLLLTLLTAGCTRSSSTHETVHTVYVQSGTDATAAQGTVDGSGADPRKSTPAEINQILFSPDEPDLGIKRRLRILFHRMAYLRPLQTDGDLHRIREPEIGFFNSLTGGSTEPSKGRELAVWKVLDRMLADQTGQPSIQQDIDALVLKVQDHFCLSRDGRHAIMAIQDHTLCVSRDLEATIAPENLLLQTLATGAHEVAHLRGITSEEEADLVRDYVIDYAAFLVQDPDLGTLNLENYLAISAIAPSLFSDPNDRLYPKELRCERLRYATEFNTGVGAEIKSDLALLIERNCWGIDPATLPREASSGATEAKVQATEVADQTRAFLRTVEARRRQFERVLSPFFHWQSEGMRSMVLDHYLLANAIAPLLDDKGHWQPQLDDAAGSRLRQSVQCSVDNQPLKFSADQCPKPNEEVDSSKPLWESQPIQVRDQTFSGKICSAVRRHDARGFDHQVLFVLGPYTANSEDVEFSMRHNTPLPDLVHLEVLLNVDRAEEMNHGKPSSNFKNWRDSFKGGIFVPLIQTQAGFPTPANNVGLSMGDVQASVEAILHPQTAPQIHFGLQLPSAYDQFQDQILYDQAIPVDCRLLSN